MEGHNKFSIALRYQEKPKNYNKAMVASIFMTLGSFALALIMLLIPTSDSSSTLRYILFGIMLAIGIFFLAFIPLIKRNKLKALKTNTYPEEAIYFDNGDICIQTDEVVKIKLDEIKKVTVLHNEEVKSYGPVQQRKTLPDGSITIVTVDKKHFIPQLRNIDFVKELILRLKETKKLLVNNTLFLYDGKKTDTYVAHLNLNEIKVKITLDAKEENLAKANSTACKIIKGFSNFHARVLEATAEQLSPLASELNQEYFPAEQNITTEEFISAIKNNPICIAVDKNHYTVIWEDDSELFFGHAILCEGNIDDNEITATYAG